MDKKITHTIEEVYDEFNKMCMKHTIDDEQHCYLDGEKCKYNKYCLESDGFIPYLMDNYNITLEEKC